MNWQERITHYDEHSGFPNCLFIAGDGRVVGTFILGNDYRVKSGYYGGYPATYLKRICSLFPDKKKVLHLFSGKVDLNIIPGDTFDMQPELEPDYIGDAHNLSDLVPIKDYDLVLADPPYSGEDAEHYGTPMINRNKIMRELEMVRAGTHVVWIDQAWPMYSKNMFDLEGVIGQFNLDAAIGVIRSTNHRVRMVFIFCRRPSNRTYIKF